ncbi:transcriptional regulator [Paenibacillus sp. PK3_47]|uniref:LysR family transcriptional regulator n=1 Tax=Paenibacillus sp. PK3_47 TaxID=2072642 RepID=UPI00201D66F0|nr:LysR family transcriptional regulator [Paenibacillus sp. PK3_47]UQZ37048.1 transcriptional regulator [Paenibacillus sp. PK3_47]
MNIVKLQIVVLIEKYKKVTDVAAEMGLKQPTVSFHMKSLENELGASLFQYRSGRVLFTDAGRALYQYAVRIVSLAAEAERSVRQLSSFSSGTLELEAGYLPGTYLVPKMLTQFIKLHPEADVSLSVQSEHLVRERLRARDIQLAVLPVTDQPDESLHTALIAEDEVVLIFAPDHPLAGAVELTAETAARETWIQHDPTSFLRAISDKWAQENQVRLWSHTVVNTPEAFKRMVCEGGCVGLFSKKGIEAEVAAGRLQYAALPGIPPKQASYVAAWRKDHTLTPMQQAFVDMTAAKDEDEL